MQTATPPETVAEQVLSQTAAPSEAVAEQVMLEAATPPEAVAEQVLLQTAAPPEAAPASQPAPAVQPTSVRATMGQAGIMTEDVANTEAAADSTKPESPPVPQPTCRCCASRRW